MNDIERKELTKKNQMAKLDAMSSLTIIEVIMYILFVVTIIVSIILFYRKLYIGFIFIAIAIVFFAIGRILNSLKYNKELLKEIYVELNFLKEENRK